MSSALQATADFVELLKRAVTNFNLTATLPVIDFDLHAGDVGKQLFKRLCIGIFLNRRAYPALAQHRCALVTALRPDEQTNLP